MRYQQAWQFAITAQSAVCVRLGSREQIYMLWLVVAGHHWLAANEIAALSGL